MSLTTALGTKAPFQTLSWIKSHCREEFCPCRKLPDHIIPPPAFFLTYKGCLEPEHMKRESYLQHVTLNQRIEMPWVWEHRPCTRRRKSVFRERRIKTPVPPPSGWGPASLGVTFLLPSVLFQSHLPPVAVSLS